MDIQKGEALNTFINGFPSKQLLEKKQNQLRLTFSLR